MLIKCYVVVTCQFSLDKGNFVSKSVGFLSAESIHLNHALYFSLPDYKAKKKFQSLLLLLYKRTPN